VLWRLGQQLGRDADLDVLGEEHDSDPGWRRRGRGVDLPPRDPDGARRPHHAGHVSPERLGSRRTSVASRARACTAGEGRAYCETRARARSDVRGYGLMQPVRRRVQVATGRRQRRVAEKVADLGHVGPVFQRHGGEAVTQRVHHGTGRNRRPDPRPRVQPLDQILHAATRKPAAVVMHQRRGRGVLQRLLAVPLGARGQVDVDDPPQGAARSGSLGPSCPCRSPEPTGAAATGDRVQIQGDELLQADARHAQRADERDVTLGPVLDG
jgi:hypothetical protein